MTRLFADAVYWIAIANHKDQWHAKFIKVGMVQKRPFSGNTRDLSADPHGAIEV